MSMKNKFLHPTKYVVIVILAVNVLVGVLMLFSFLSARSRRLNLYSEQAAARWDNKDMDYAEISLFYSEASGLDAGSIQNIRNSIQKKLYDDSYLSDDAEGRVWIDAYCGHTFDEVRKDSNSIKVNVYTVGGDFFQIHPIPLKSGSYLDMESSDVNQILLDEYVAWDLFGGSDVSGMKLWIGDSVFTVTGVVKVDESKAYTQAYGEYNSVYVPIESYSRKDAQSGDKFDEAQLDTSDSTGSSGNDGTKALCYEAVLPSPIKNYALNVVAEAAGIEFKSDEEKEKMRSSLNFEDIEIVDNTARFKMMQLFTNSRNRDYIEMRANNIYYPYWENIARHEETHQYKSLCYRAWLLVIPILSLIYACIVAFNILNEEISKLRAARRKY